MSRTTIGASLAALAVMAAAVLVFVLPAAAAQSRVGFSFNAPSIAGFPAGAVFLTGGGAYDPVNVTPESFVHSGGGFRCIDDVVGNVPLNGCLTGQGVRWDTEGLLPSTGFKCTASETKRTATTGPGTVVLDADFYRAGDGNEESFKAQMIVSQDDLDTAIEGDQHVWIQGVGCGTGNVNFS
jgi:hypothetical protein